MASRRLRSLADHAATWVITAGGLATILAIFGIFVYLFIEVAPLFSASSAEKAGEFPVEASRIGAPAEAMVGVDEYLEVAYVIDGTRLRFQRLPSGAPIPLGSRTFEAAGPVTAVARSGSAGHRFALGTATGQVVPVSVSFESRYEGGVRTVHPRSQVGEPFQGVPSAEPIVRLAYRAHEDGPVAAAGTQSGRLWVAKGRQRGGLFALEEKLEFTRVELLPRIDAGITALLLERSAERLLVGSANGRLYHWDLSDVERPRLMGTYAAARESDAVTALAYLVGDRAIVVGTGTGTVSVWMPMLDPDKGGDPYLRQVRELQAHRGAVTGVSPSLRDKGFVTADDTGQIFVHHSTSGQTLLHLDATGTPVRALMFAPKADGVIALDQRGTVHGYAIDNAHPEVTLETLFTPVLYEGYDEPKHIWQSSSGSDDFEPKFGMWPLIFGTLKGTMYAMLLATPIALLGAIYTAMFMSHNVRAVVKPVVETMEALPTVVLGFLAGLWFAPVLEQIFPGVAAAFLVVPASIVLVCVGWQFLPTWIQRRAGSATELTLFMVVIVGSAWLCLAISDQIEAWIFGGDYKAFIQSVFGVAYDQRNAIVIAFAMGMAVIPTIFSISEDSISNVPRHLIAGSLAMGATPWQTLTKLVLVSASPGLFSALMIGLGRVVGETMIVLMATGNTPVMELNPFNGFRTLSANIAVEMPEAPHGGTLYRLLFLAGLILFVFTSVVNSIAEVIRQRLRKRYSQF